MNAIFIISSFFNDAFDELDNKDFTDLELTEDFALLFDEIDEHTDSLSS